MQTDSAQTELERETRKQTRRGVLAGVLLFVWIMLLLAAGAVGFRLVAHDDAGRLDLTTWLVIENLGGSVVSFLAGALSAHIAVRFRATVVLAGILLGISLLEAAELLRIAATGRIVAPTWLVLLAPVVITIGTVFGGWVRLGKTRPQWRRTTVIPARQALRLASPVFVLGTAVVLAVWVLPQFQTRQSVVVASALALDLTVVVPSLAYAVLVRTRRAPWVVLIPIFGVGYAIAAATISVDQPVLRIVRLLIFPAELAAIGYLILLARRAASIARGIEGDFASRLRTAARSALKSRVPADIMATEVSLIAYALRRPRSRSVLSNEYTVYRESKYKTVVVGFLLVIFLEAIPVHLLVSSWSTLAAWVVTALTAYAAIWFVGDYRAMVARPTRLTPTHLLLRVGVRWEADIPREAICAVDTHIRLSEHPARTTLVARLIGRPTVRIRLTEPVEVIGMYGIQKSTQEIWLTVDQADDLCRELSKNVAQTR